LFSAPFLLTGLLLTSCASYKQNIMFKVPEGQTLATEVEKAEKDYTIAPNDLLELEVYTNQGERLIDPEVYLKTDRPDPESSDTDLPQYRVDNQGIAKLPVVGEINIKGLTIRQAESLLQKQYEKYYKEPFVVLRFANKRVVVLGGPGGQVIPLTNENTTLTEVIALAKGVDNFSKAHNIRVLRNDQVFLIDFSTIDGFKKGNMIIEPNDVVYIEPIRRPFSEGLRDYAPAFTILTSLATLIIVIVTL